MNIRIVCVAAIGLVVSGLTACGPSPTETGGGANQQAAPFDERSKTFGDYEVFDQFDKVPGPAGSSRACNAAVKNETYVVPAL